MHFPALLNMFTQCDVIKNWRDVICYGAATSRHKVSILNFSALITEMEVFFMYVYNKNIITLVN